MKRLFPRAVPEALVAFLFVGVACAPSSPVQPGAPVLMALSIVDPSGSHVDVTADTAACAVGSAEGKDCDPGTAVCELDANVVCSCVAKDMCDPTIVPDAAATGGTLNCTFAPLSTVRAIFDRILDTSPFEAGTPVASLTADPTSTAKAATDYTASGAAKGLVFTFFFGAPNGPHIDVSGDPALPTDSTLTFALDKSKVQAKDKKTAFTGANLLADGTIAFKTSSFSASVTVPAPPPPMSMGMGMMMMGCPPPPSNETDGGSDAAMGGSDGGVDGAAAEVGATIDAGAPEVGATVDAGAASDAGTPTPPSTDVPADMNMAAITIAFTNTVKDDVLMHITMTEDGKPFMDFMTSMDTMFPTATVKIVPKTAWAAGKTYAITVDKDAADALGKKLGGTGAMGSFTMAAN
jgi:hypothetical protein